jgi:rhamnulokinase
MLGRVTEGRLSLEEVHRFSGYAVQRADGPHWDVSRLLKEIEIGLDKACAAAGAIDSIGVDSWGLDYGLYNRGGALMGEPYHYRHPRSQRGYSACALSAEALFAVTGVQNLPVNTIYQLIDEARQSPERLVGAAHLLMIADLVNHHLTGAFRSEVTLARTSGLLDANTDGWSLDLCGRLGVPAHMLAAPIKAGEQFGSLRRALAEPRGLGDVPVIAVAAHDTASAVTALNLEGGAGFLICGSWFLIGVEQSRIDTRPAVREAGFGNEGGVAGRSFLVKSLNGLHLIQKLRDAWERRTGQKVDFAELSQMADAADPGILPIDTEDPSFFNPPDIVEAVRSYAAARRRPVPDDLGGVARAIYVGLAVAVSRAVNTLEGLLDRPLQGLKLCGGGAQDRFLCRLLAEATGRDLRVGPIEASAWGNAVVQLMGLGLLKTLDDARKLVEDSAEFRECARIERDHWIRHAGD